MQPVLWNAWSAIGDIMVAEPLLTDCDTITVDLHDSTPGSTFNIIASAQAIIHTDGTASVIFPGSVAGGAYYIAVRNRTLVETWSALPVAFSATTTYDFATTSTPGVDEQSYGPNQREIEPGVWAMYSGDIDADYFVTANDFALIMDFNIQFPIMHRNAHFSTFHQATK